MKHFPGNFFESILLVVLFFIFSSIVLIPNILFKFGIDKYIITSISFVFGFCLLLLFLRKINKKKLQLNYKLIGKRPLLLLIFLTILCCIALLHPFSIFLTNLFNREGTLSNPFNTLFLGSILIAPFIEEVIFRGIILKGLTQKYSISTSILLSTLLFSVLHLSVSQIVSGIIFGLFFGFIFIKYNSILIPIILHFTANLSISLLSYIHYNYGNFVINSISDLYGTYSLYILGISLIFLAFILMHLKNKGYFKL